MQYERILLMDSDLQIVGGVDHLLRCGAHTFLATPGFFSPLNGGLWVLTPSLCTYQDMVQLVLQGNYSNQNHWGGLSAEANHVGAEGPQGFLCVNLLLCKNKLLLLYHSYHCSYHMYCVL